MNENYSYKKNEKIKLRQEEFGGLLFNPKYWRIYQVNKICYQILDFCQEKKTFEEISDFIYKRHSFKFSIEEVSNFLNKLTDIEVLEKYE